MVEVNTHQGGDQERDAQDDRAHPAGHHPLDRHVGETLSPNETVKRPYEQQADGPQEQEAADKPPDVSVAEVGVEAEGEEDRRGEQYVKDDLIDGVDVGLLVQGAEQDGGKAHLRGRAEGRSRVSWVGWVGGNSGVGSGAFFANSPLWQ